MPELQIVQTLKGLGYPVFLHGTLGENEPFPDTFLTYQTVDSPDAFPFDNEPTYTAWEYTVIVYSNDRQTLEETAAAARVALKASGFIPQGKGRDIPSDEPTHTGWLCDFKLLANY